MTEKRRKESRPREFGFHSSNLGHVRVIVYDPHARKRWLQRIKTQIARGNYPITPEKLDVVAKRCLDDITSV
jgi:anti-sigma28 factor (negative regulator of flagellin synthesis)